MSLDDTTSPTPLHFFSFELALVPPGEILVDRDLRQRRNIDSSDLQQSIAKFGLFNPLIVKRATMKLVMGERRLHAVRALAHKTVPVRWAEDLSAVELEAIELEENLRRTSLEWQDTARAYFRIHQLLRSQDPDWTAAETAAYMGVSKGEISKNLRLVIELDAGNQKVLDAAKREEAYNSLVRRDKRMEAKALEDLMEGAPGLSAPAEPKGEESPAGEPRPAPPLVAAGDVIQGSFLDWAPSYVGPKFNLIHCDFPYGVGVFGGPQMSGGADLQYEDGKEIYFELLECLCHHTEALASVTSHLMFWFSMKHYEPTLRMFRNLAPSWEFSPHLLIWHKTDNAGIIGDSQRDFRHVHETALLARRGRRVLVKNVSDTYGAPTARDLHPSAKPEPMLKHFLSALVDEHTTLLDPTCGSGTALLAADALAAARVCGIEREPTYVDSTRSSLTLARRLRQMAKMTMPVENPK